MGTNKAEYSCMVVGDLHGRIYAFEQAVEEFEKSKLDMLILIGDYCDSYDATGTEIIHLVKSVISYKQANMSKVICLYGNHDVQYPYSPDYRAKGFKTEIYPDLFKLFTENRDLFQIAFKNGNYFFTHAGLLQDWVTKYNDRLSYYEDKFSIDRHDNLDILLNSIDNTHDRWILNTVPICRGGCIGSIGGPLWADISEIVEGNGCVHRYTHIIGHNKVKDITRFKNAKSEVIFVDCLAMNLNFLTITE